MRDDVHGMTSTTTGRIRGFSSGEIICLGRLAVETSALLERHDGARHGGEERRGTARTVAARHRSPGAHRHAQLQ
jgi:hypothetical protein